MVFHCAESLCFQCLDKAISKYQLIIEFLPDEAIIKISGTYWISNFICAKLATEIFLIILSKLVFWSTAAYSCKNVNWAFLYLINLVHNILIHMRT